MEESKKITSTNLRDYLDDNDFEDFARKFKKDERNKNINLMDFYDEFYDTKRQTLTHNLTKLQPIIRPQAKQLWFEKHVEYINLLSKLKHIENQDA